MKVNQSIVLAPAAASTNPIPPVPKINKGIKSSQPVLFDHPGATLISNVSPGILIYLVKNNTGSVLHIVNQQTGIIKQLFAEKGMLGYIGLPDNRLALIYIDKILIVNIITGLILFTLPIDVLNRSISGYVLYALGLTRYSDPAWSTGKYKYRLDTADVSINNKYLIISFSAFQPVDWLYGRITVIAVIDLETNQSKLIRIDSGIKSVALIKSGQLFIIYDTPIYSTQSNASRSSKKYVLGVIEFNMTSAPPSFKEVFSPDFDINYGPAHGPCVYGGWDGSQIIVQTSPRDFLERAENLVLYLCSLEKNELGYKLLFRCKIGNIHLYDPRPSRQGLATCNSLVYQEPGGSAGSSPKLMEFCIDNLEKTELNIQDVVFDYSKPVVLFANSKLGIPRVYLDGVNYEYCTLESEVRYQVQCAREKELISPLIINAAPCLIPDVVRVILSFHQIEHNVRFFPSVPGLLTSKSEEARLEPLGLVEP